MFWPFFYYNRVGQKSKIMSIESKMRSMESKNKVGRKETKDYTMVAFKSRGQ